MACRAHSRASVDAGRGRQCPASDDSRHPGPQACPRLAGRKSTLQCRRISRGLWLYCCRFLTGNCAPAVLRLLCKETGNNVTLLEETEPAGTETTFHLHRNCDEVAQVLSAEIT